MVEPPDGEQEEAQREKGRDKLERVLRRSLFFQPERVLRSSNYW